MLGAGLCTDADQGHVDQSKPGLPQSAEEATEGNEEVFEGAKESAAQDDQERPEEYEAASEAVLIVNSDPAILPPAILPPLVTAGT